MRLAALGIVLCALCALASSDPVLAQEDCLHYEDHFHWAGGAEAPEGAKHIAPGAGMAVVARGSYLQHCDLSDPCTPGFGDTLELANDIFGLDLIETTAFLANGAGGLLLVDVSDPNELVALDSLGFGGDVVGVAATTHPVYVIEEYGEFYTVNYSDPHDLELSGHVHIPSDYCEAVAAGVNERYAYVAGYDSLYVIDCYDSDHPVLAASIHPNADVEHVCVVSAERAYIAGYGDDDYDYVLVPLDISDPTDPHVGAPFPLPSQATSLYGRGDLAYVGCESDGLLIVDVPDPRFPELLHTADVYDPGGIMATDEHVIACSDGNWSLEVFAQMTQPAAEPLAARPERRATDATVYQRYATVLDYADSLFIYDCIDPTDPVLLGVEALPSSSGSWHMVSDGHYAFYTTTDGSFHTVRLEDPTDPEYLGGIDTPGYSPNLDLCPSVGACAAVADGNGGFHLIDLHDLANPAIVHTEPLLACNGLDVVGSTLYAGDWNTLRIYDISNPTAPVETGSSDPIPEEISCVAVAGDHAFVTDYNGRFYVFDVSVPTAPQWIAYLNILQSSGYDLLVEGDYAYLANDWQGMIVIDVSEPADPRAIGCLPGSSTIGLGVGDGYLCVANSDLGFGFQIAPLQCPATAAVPDGEPGMPLRLVHCRPNPVGARATLSYELPVAGPARLDIVDVTGRLVTTLVERAERGGTHEVTWDGRAGGQPIAPGVYFARLAGAGMASAQCRITIVR